LIATRAATARSATERHRLLGVGYVRFATANPGLFRLIGNREITGAIPTRELSNARVAAAQLFGSAVLDLTARRNDAALDPKLAAIAGWSMMQGLATLLIEGQLTPGLLGAADEVTAAERVAGLFTDLLVGDARDA